MIKVESCKNCEKFCTIFAVANFPGACIVKIVLILSSLPREMSTGKSPVRILPLARKFHSVIPQLLDGHAPLKSRWRVGKNDCRWLSDEARVAKRLSRRRECRYRRTQNANTT